MIPSLETPILGVIADPKMKENGLCEMMRVARCAAIAPVDSVLHRMLDFSCPVRSLDMTFAELRAAVKSLTDRGIQLDAVLSLRDGNVEQAARMTAELRRRRGLPVPTLTPFRRVSDKFSFRSWLNRFGQELPLQSVPSKKLVASLAKAEFIGIVNKMARRHGRLILKPNRGSCSQLIVEIVDDSVAEVAKAWEIYQQCRSFRRGECILEKWIDGDEYALESVVTDRVIAHYVAGYRAPPKGKYYAAGASVPPIPLLTDAQCQLLKTLSESLHALLGLKFIITHLELKWPKGASAPSIVELNPRLAGGMLPEMYRLVNGAELYKATAMLVLGQFPSDDVLHGPPLADLVVDQFLAPFAGKVRLTSQRGLPLRGRHDRFSVLSRLDTFYDGGTSDEDLRAWSVSAGRLQKSQSFDDLYCHLSKENETRLHDWLAAVRRK